MRRVFRLKTPQDTEALGRRLAARLSRGQLVALFGPLGAGKTTLVRGLARGLGYSGRVRSPSFTLVNRYPGRIPIWHYDLYRLEGVDLGQLDLDLALAQGVAVVEWAERAAWLPAPRWEVWLDYWGEGRVAELRLVAATM